MHDQPALMRAIAVADRPQAARLRMLAVGEEHRVLHNQHRSAYTRYALERRLDMRLENGLAARITVVKQTIGALRARPIPTGFIDRRGRGVGKLFGGLDQATIQAFVGQVNAGELLRHPLHRLGAGLDDSLHLGIFPSRCLRQAACYPSSHVATRRRIANERRCVQRSLCGAQYDRGTLKTCVE